MTDLLGASSNADLVWAGEGYSAFASATATQNNLTISYIDVNKTVRYDYTLTNSWYWNSSYPTFSNTSSNISYSNTSSNISYSTYIPNDGTMIEPNYGILVVSGGFLTVVFLAIVVAFIQKFKTTRHNRKKIYPEAKFKILQSPLNNVENLTVLTKLDSPSI